jgi:hypothetical protein
VVSIPLLPHAKSRFNLVEKRDPFVNTKALGYLSPQSAGSDKSSSVIPPAEKMSDFPAGLLAEFPRLCSRLRVRKGPFEQPGDHSPINRRSDIGGAAVLSMTISRRCTRLLHAIASQVAVRRNRQRHAWMKAVAFSVGFCGRRGSIELTPF